jgi:uncharacterized protein with HEPN domain
MLTGAMLGLMRQIGLDIITLTEEIGEAEFFSSRFTQAETLRLLGNMVKTANDIPETVRERMPQIDWAAWAELQSKLDQPSKYPFQLWVVIKELTPLTVQHLNEYRRTQPKLFSFVA